MMWWLPATWAILKPALSSTWTIRSHRARRAPEASGHSDHESPARPGTELGDQAPGGLACISCGPPRTKLPNAGSRFGSVNDLHQDRHVL